MTEWWPRIKGRKRWRGCDEAGETRSEELLARTIRPSEYNGRSTECYVLLDRIFAGKVVVPWDVAGWTS